jgi:hypothetical protein
VTFVEKVGSAGKFKPLLYVSWGILVLGLLLNVRAFLLLQNSYNRLLAVNDDLYVRGTTVLQNPFRTRGGDFNRYSFWCFVLGIVLLLIFAGVNYQASSKETSQIERTVITVEGNKGLIARIFKVDKTAGGSDVVKLPNSPRPAIGPDVVKLPHPPQGSSGSQSPMKAPPRPATTERH